MEIRIEEITRTKADAERLAEYAGLVLNLVKEKSQLLGEVQGVRAQIEEFTKQKGGA